MDIGPGPLATPSGAGGRPFLLSSDNWLAIQTYVNDALALPTTEETFKTSLGPGAPSDCSEFKPLIAAYLDIHTHVKKWHDITYPEAIKLADKIHDYSIKAPIYYEPILKLAEALDKDPDDEKTKKELTDILENLSKTAQDNQKDAVALMGNINEFASDTSQDKLTLSGKDGKGGLKKTFDDKYGTTATDVSNITTEVDTLKAQLKDYNDEYDHDVVVAATTPCYVWVIPPWGTIAAVVVAGVFGDKAVKTLENVRACQQKINDLESKLAADANLLIGIHGAESGLINILADIQSALPIIEKIAGCWGAISSDLNNIINIIKNDIAGVPACIMNLGVEEAIEEWKAVGNEANDFRVNAYITVESKPTLWN